MMGGKPPFSFGEEPSDQLTQLFSIGVSMACLHGPHKALLTRMEPTQATAT